MVSISASDFFHDMLLFLGLKPDCFYKPLIPFSLSRPFAQGLSIQDLYNVAEAIDWGVVNVPLTELQWMYNIMIS